MGPVSPGNFTYNLTSPGYYKFSIGTEMHNPDGIFIQFQYAYNDTEGIPVSTHLSNP